MPVAPEVRAATDADGDAVADVYRRSSLVWDDHRADLEANPELLVFDPAAVHDGHVRVAVVEGRVVGFSTVLPSGPGTGELEDLFVDPEVMRTGVGRRLVDDLVAVGRAAGLRRVEVTANPNAVPFYERCGFVHDAEVETLFGPGFRMHLDL